MRYEPNFPVNFGSENAANDLLFGIGVITAEDHAATKARIAARYEQPVQVDVAAIASKWDKQPEQPQLTGFEKSLCK